MSGNDNPNNEYEIFVSYSHRDNLLLIDYFIQQLREAAKLGKISLSKFIDEQDIVGDWETSILSHLESSNIFMPFITPTYLESDECIKELSTFVALARRSEEVKLIAPVFWKTVDENELPDNGYSREAYRYLNRVQGITDNGKKDLSSKDPEAIPFVKIFLFLRRSLDRASDTLQIKKQIAENIIPELDSSLRGHVSERIGTVLPPDDDVQVQAPEPVNTKIGVAQAKNAIVSDKPAPLPTPSDAAPQVTKTPVKGSQNHEGYAPAHELMVKIYNTVAETPFVEGSKDRSSALKPEFRVPGVLETVSLTRDGVHPTQGMNFNLNSNLAPVYISANWQGVPNDGSGRDYERGKRELGRFAILPSIHRLESYEPWEQDFGNTLANYLYRIKMAEPYAQEYLRHKDEWQERLVRFAGSPDVKNSLKNELFAWGRFHSANSRLEFVRDGKLLPVWEIDNDLLNRTVIDITDPTEVDEILELLDGIGKSGVRYFRTGAPRDTDKDYMKFLDALHAYRAFLE